MPNSANAVVQAADYADACKQAVAEAEDKFQHALNAVDDALAAEGWQRMYGAFKGRLYQQLGGTTVTFDDLVAHYRQRRAA